MTKSISKKAINPNWRDETTHSHDEVDRTPRLWALNLESVRIFVHRDIDFPGKWFVSCYKLGIEDEMLEASKIDRAKKEGLNLVRRRLRKWYLEVRAAMQLPGGPSI